MPNASNVPPVYVVVTCRNAAETLPKMLGSLLAQTLKEFGCVIYDDASSDTTAQLLREHVGKDPRFILLRGTEPAGAAAGRWKALNRIRAASRKTIIVLLDGDDWLYDDTVLQFLVEKYYRSRYLSGHGNFITSEGAVCSWSADYPDQVKQQSSYRVQPWVATHLRWFRFGLKPFIPYVTQLDEDGAPFRVSTDLALFLPVLELSGVFTAYCEKPLYVYNQRNGAIAAPERVRQQREAEAVIRAKPRLTPINPELVL